MFAARFSAPCRPVPVLRQASSTETEVPIRGHRGGASVFLRGRRAAASRPSYAAYHDLGKQTRRLANPLQNK